MDEARILNGLLQLGVLIFSLCLHEFGHALVANRLGDPTAKMVGRLTLDPRVHVHPIGTILFPLLMIFFPGLPLIGWAKPVPVTAENFKRPRWDMTLVAAAGPSMNLLLSSLAVLALWFLNQAQFFQADTATQFVVVKVLGLFIIINFFLAVFNLIPFPPLDGGWFLKAVLPPQWAYRLARIEPFSVLLLWLSLQLGLLNLFFNPALLFLMIVLNALGIDQLLAGFLS